jgi:hypothetical protein
MQGWTGMLETVTARDLNQVATADIFPVCEIPRTDIRRFDVAVAASLESVSNAVRG